MHADDALEDILNIILLGNRPIRTVVRLAKPNVAAAHTELELAFRQAMQEVCSRLTVHLLRDRELRPLIPLRFKEHREILNSGFVRLNNPVWETALALWLCE